MRKLLMVLATVFVGANVATTAHAGLLPASSPVNASCVDSYARLPVVNQNVGTKACSVKVTLAPLVVDCLGDRDEDGRQPYPECTISGVSGLTLKCGPANQYSVWFYDPRCTGGSMGAIATTIDCGRKPYFQFNADGYGCLIDLANSDLGIHADCEQQTGDTNYSFCVARLASSAAVIDAECSTSSGYVGLGGYDRCAALTDPASPASARCDRTSSNYGVTTPLICTATVRPPNSPPTTCRVDVPVDATLHLPSGLPEFKGCS